MLVPIDPDGAVDLEGVATHPALPEVIAATVSLYQRRGFVRPWIGYVAVEARQVVGSCGFAAPAAGAEAEIAYFTFPGQEGRGVATRMASALIDLTCDVALSQNIRFVAHTLPEEGPSPAILRRLGFTLLGTIEHPEDGPVWKWCYTPTRG